MPSGPPLVNLLFCGFIFQEPVKLGLFCATANAAHRQANTITIVKTPKTRIERDFICLLLLLFGSGCCLDLAFTAFPAPRSHQHCLSGPGGAPPSSLFS